MCIVLLPYMTKLILLVELEKYVFLYFPIMNLEYQLSNTAITILYRFITFLDLNLQMTVLHLELCDFIF